MPSIVISNETPSVITNDVEEIEPQPTNYINLHVKDTDDIKLYFRLKKTTQMRKLMDSYCDRNALDFYLMVFLFNGRRIYPHQTPYELDLEDDDAIDAVLHQQWRREPINIKVKGQDGFQASFRIRKSAALKKLMDQYCYQYCLDVNGVGLLFNGYLVQPEQTPFELGIEDGDEMLAMLHLRTGHARCL
ncbi:small ubiquitin-like modifier 3 [Medicago truncatula]|uniref:Small ubiquitin-like modifier 3 n=1 Tax=Medicago truncatula TaxID=3880 RepID=G7ZWS0_MEDTR|nr:small ubiquitin-like modifier 3 [Medicago truncatula]